MKCVYVVALFAFVALQVCHAAPVPEEEKKVEATVPEVVAETVGPAAVAGVEGASEKAASAAPAAAPSESATVAVEEKKA